MTIQGDTGERARASIGAGLILLSSIAFVPACRDEPRSWGEAVDPSAAVPLAQLLADDSGTAKDTVTVTGDIAEVCRSSGCWFVLREVSDGRVHELFVDLKPRADFTLPSSVTDRRAVVSGRLVGRDPDLKLEAVGLIVE